MARYTEEERARLAPLEAQRDHAAHRAELAEARADKWADETLHWQAKADSTRSARWRRTWQGKADRAFMLGRRAHLDAAQWRGRERRWKKAIREEQKAIREERAKRKKKKPPRRVEYVIKVQYKGEGRRGRRQAGHAVWWDVRIAKRDGSAADDRELERVVRYVRHTGEVPDDWTLLAIAWDRGNRESFEDVPSRTPKMEDPDAVLGQLAATLGRTRGFDYEFGVDDDGMLEVGEEERDEDEDDEF